MRAALCAALVLALTPLAGCYVSEAPLLSERDAVHPVVAGLQTSVSDGRERRVDARIEPSGWYQIIEDGEVTEILFTPLAALGQRTVFAFMFKEEDVFVYGVAERRDGRVLLDLPSCDPGPALEVALAHDAEPPTPGVIGAACAFRTEAELRAALLDYARRPDVERDYLTLSAAPE